jgi:FtsP/CotA-like multicopper oxidase with cupredoxin domain
MKTLLSTLRGACTAALVVLLATAGEATARVDGITGTGTGTPADPRSFNLVAMDAQIVTGDANTIYAWGYADASTGIMQYPGPTLIVNQGDTVRITLANTLPVPVSIVFPGQQGVTATCNTAANCQDGLLAMEVKPGTPTVPTGSLTYTFTASQPGTYLYHSGTQVSLCTGRDAIRPRVPVSAVRHGRGNPRQDVHAR